MEVNVSDASTTASSAGTSISSSDDLADDHVDDSLLNVPTGLSEIYSVAGLYEEALASTGCLGNEDGVQTGRVLAGETLNPAEHAFVARLAQLSLASRVWLPDKSAEAESPSSSEDIALDEESGHEDYSDLDDSSQSSSRGPTLRRAGTIEEQERYAFPPEVVIQLLVNEFGPLGEPGNVEDAEKLILETDGGLQVQDVVIVGVIHVTTHRLAFHASLLSTQPGFGAAPIKSGPATIHFKGWKTKQRVWLELSHDVLCTYASSSHEDKIRPVRSLLLSAVKKVHSIDANKPTYVRFLFRIGDKDFARALEFDTEEAAFDWHREIAGALYIHRHARREILEPKPSSAGIRLSIPLERITQHRFGDLAAVPFVATLQVELSELDTNRGPKTIFQSTAFQDEASHQHHSKDTTQGLHVGVLRDEPAWMKLGQYIAAAKRKASAAPSAEHQVFIDFGPLTYGEDSSHTRESGAIPSGSLHSSNDLVEGSSIRETGGAHDPHPQEALLRAIFALDDTEQDLWIIRGSLYHSILTSGFFILSAHHISFWCKYYTRPDIRYRIPVGTVKSATIFYSKFCPKSHGMCIQLDAHADLKFQFQTAKLRDEVVSRINDRVEKHRVAEVKKGAEKTSSSADSIRSKHSATNLFSPVARSTAAAKSFTFSRVLSTKLPKAINVPSKILMRYDPMHFVCLTIGSRGDVQPYIALGLGLLKEGHRVTIATHDEYAEWIRSHGIEHRSAGGDPGALMKLSVENKMFSPQFFKEGITNFRPWLDQLLVDAWAACQEADVLIESPSAMAGVHIAEALDIPYFRSFTMPWTLTSDFPHAFLSPPVESPAFNRSSYILYENVIWASTSGQINKWRRKVLGLKNTDQEHIAAGKIPFLYNFSSAVVPKPLDWGDATVVTGYWFLDNPDGPTWQAPPGLLEFIAQARADGKPLVYIGFGSITVPHPNRVTKRVIQAVVKSNVRAIISKGWSARMSTGLNDDPLPEIPPECYQLDKVPHDWLFPQVDAAFHHGGAGTTGASLRAGIPTIIKPFFGDQYFWASRVQKLGAGLRVPSLRVNDMAQALAKATSSRVMKEMAAGVGERIRAEDGVHNAIHALYTYLPRASKPRTGNEKSKRLTECYNNAKRSA